MVAPRSTLVFMWLPLFIMGILSFQLASKVIRLPEYAFLLGADFWLASSTFGTAIPIVAAATALTIAFVKVRAWRWLTSLGAMSYSIYLLHVPIGGRILNLGARVSASSEYRLVVLAIAIAGTLIASIYFYRFVERPSQNWSKGIRYRANASPVDALAAPAAREVSV